MKNELEPFARRVRELRARHAAFAAVGVVLGLGALGLDAVFGAAEAPIGVRLFFCLGGLSVGAWQLALAFRIGRGVAALQAGRLVTWIYVLHAYIHGSHVAAGVMVGLDGGERWELPTPSDVDPQAAAAALARAHPRAAVGFDAATEARFVADPRSLLRS